MAMAGQGPRRKLGGARGAAGHAGPRAPRALPGAAGARTTSEDEQAVSTDTLGPLRPSAKDTRPHATDSVPLVAEKALGGACAAQLRKYSV